MNTPDTLEAARANLEAARAAYRRALDAKSVGFDGGRMVTRQNIDALRAEIAHWERTIAHLDGTARRVQRLIVTG